MNIEAMQKIIKDNTDLLIQKNEDYGSDNLLVTGVRGMVVRLMDKVNRLMTLTADGRSPNYESIDDTFGDVANYGVIGQALRRGILERRSLVVYLAGPIDLAEELEAYEWRVEAARYLSEAGHTAFNPAMAFLGANRHNAEVVETINRAAIDNSDVIIANLTKRMSLGTIREIEYGKVYGKRVVVASELLGGSFATWDLEIVPTLADALRVVAPPLPEDPFSGRDHDSSADDQEPAE
jgi:hypothetical protein